jgi:hypothetical protein
MADIKFACPHCSQHITCDELWGGHQLECPNCKNPLSVPAVAAAPATPSAPSLVPKPPAAVEPRLSIGASQQSVAAASPQKVIPIRNLAPAAAKKRSPLVTYGVGALVLVGLAVGGYYGYGWMSAMQGKVNEASKEAAKNADGGQVAHIAKLNAVLDATDPNKAPVDTRSTGPRQRRSGVGQEIPVAGAPDAGGGAATNSADAQPLIPAVWTLDIAKARIPSGKANGAISGTNFLPEIARIDPIRGAQVLRLLQGPPASPDREMLVYLHLKPGETLGGQTVSISQEMAGQGVPQVTKRWKNNPKFAPQYKNFSSGYAMRLELGQLSDGALPGKIFLALPDADQSVVAGNFKATLTTNVVSETAVQAVQVQSVPMTAPGVPQNSDAAWQSRYGTRRSQ